MAFVRSWGGFRLLGPDQHVPVLLRFAGQAGRVAWRAFFTPSSAWKTSAIGQGCATVKGFHWLSRDEVPSQQVGGPLVTINY